MHIKLSLIAALATAAGCGAESTSPAPPVADASVPYAPTIESGDIQLRAERAADEAERRGGAARFDRSAYVQWKVEQLELDEASQEVEMPDSEDYFLADGEQL